MVDRKEMGFVGELDCLVELHMHLDGAISAASARKLAALQGIRIPESDEELKALISIDGPCRDLNEFLSKFDFVETLLQTKEGLKMATENLLKEVCDEGVMYCEIRFAPQFHKDRGLSQQDAVEAVIEGTANSPIPCGIILCCIRGDDNHAENLETVELAERYLGKGVVGLDLAGAEALYPNRLFADLFRIAHEKNIPYTIHSGEADGPRSVRAALDMGAVRIGHGIRSTEDKELVKLLAEQGTTLELCPKSNIDTGIYPAIEAYPLRSLIDAGVKVCINTDDKTVSDTTLREEFYRVVSTFEFGPADVKKLIMNSIEASFANEATKGEMVRRLNERIPDDEK